MSQQYLRIVQVKIDGMPAITYDATRPQYGPNGPVDGLRIRFETRQADKSNPNLLQVWITNLKDETTQPAFKVGAAITLSAGYGSEVGVLFKGQIRQARNTREGVADKVLHVIAADMSTPRNYAVVNTTLSANHTHYDRAMAAVKQLQAMGCTVGYIAKDALTQTKFPRGFSIFDMAKDVLRNTCMATKTSWSIQNGAVQIVENAKAKPGAAIVLSPSSGLIGRAVQTIQGIEGTCLLNFNIVPTRAIKVDSKLIDQAVLDQSYTGAKSNDLYPKLATDGMYKVFYVGHVGDTHGEEFFTRWLAVRMADNNVPVAAAVRGLSTPNA